MKDYLEFQKKRMTKKAYKEMCKSFRSQVMLGNNYGPRIMKTKKERQKYKPDYEWG